MPSTVVRLENFAINKLERKKVKGDKTRPRVWKKEQRMDKGKRKLDIKQRGTRKKVRI